MYNSYENTQSTMEEKLQELFVVLERIGKANIQYHCYTFIDYVVATEKLEVELAQFKTALSALYSDVHGPDVV